MVGRHAKLLLDVQILAIHQYVELEIHCILVPPSL